MTNDYSMNCMLHNAGDRLVKSSVSEVSQAPTQALLVLGVGLLSHTSLPASTISGVSSAATTLLKTTAAFSAIYFLWGEMFHVAASTIEAVTNYKNGNDHANTSCSHREPQHITSILRDEFNAELKLVGDGSFAMHAE